MDLDALLRAYLDNLTRRGRRLADALRPVVFEYLRGRVKTVKLEDLVQETLTIVFAELGKFEDRGPGSFAAWVRGIARNTALVSYRHERRDRRLLDLAWFLGRIATRGLDQVHWREWLGMLREGLSELDPIYSSAVVHMAAGRDPGELAEIEDVDPKTILSRASRGRSKLREYIRKRRKTTNPFLAAIS